jgi:hypothetical protein
MVISTAVAYGVLFSVGLLVLAAFAFVFWRLERAPERTEEDRPPPPLGWPISPEASAALRPVRRRAAASRPDRSEARRPT